MRAQRLNSAERRYLDGWAVKAAARIRDRGEEPRTETVRLLMAELDQTCRRFLERAAEDKRARDATRRVIERALKTAQRAQPPRVVEIPVDRPVPGLPGIHFGQTFEVLPDPGVDEAGQMWYARPWAKWARWLGGGALLAALAAAIYLGVPLVWCLPPVLLLLTGGLHWLLLERRDCRRALRARRVAVQLAHPRDPVPSGLQILVTRADGRVVSTGDFDYAGPL